MQAIETSALVFKTIAVSSFLTVKILTSQEG